MTMLGISTPSPLLEPLFNTFAWNTHAHTYPSPDLSHHDSPFVGLQGGVKHLLGAQAAHQIVKNILGAADAVVGD